MHQKAFSKALAARLPCVFGFGILAFASVGCAVEAGSELGSEEPVASSEEAFSGVNSSIKSATTTSMFSLGTTTNRACFLSGISGRLATMNSARHGAAITSSGGNYQLTLRTSGGAKIAAGTMCVQPVSGLTNPVSWSSATSASRIVAPITNNRRCFLTRVDAIPGELANTPPFNQTDDHVGVVQQNGNWVLTGNTLNGDVEAEARCLDVTWDRGSWNWIAGPGFSSQPLAPSANTACMLTKLKGAFFSTNDTKDGIQIVWNGSDQWFMEVKNHKSGWANCVE